jgi:hypothetical protein
MRTFSKITAARDARISPFGDTGNMFRPGSPVIDHV